MSNLYPHKDSALRDPYIWACFAILGLSCRLIWLMTQVGG
jgi:hypothetical protein